MRPASTSAIRLADRRDRLFAFDLCRPLDEPTIGRCVLDDDFRLAIDGQHHGRPRLVKLLEVRRRLAFEIGQGIDVGFDSGAWDSFQTELDANSNASMFDAAGQDGYQPAIRTRLQTWPSGERTLRADGRPKRNEVPRPSGPSPPGTIRDESRTGVTARWAFRRVRERPRTRSVAPGFRVAPRWGDWAFGLRPRGDLGFRVAPVGTTRRVDHPPLLGTSMNCSGKA